MLNLKLLTYYGKTLEDTGGGDDFLNGTLLYLRRK
jgi:hypothetical protein